MPKVDSIRPTKPVRIRSGETVWKYMTATPHSVGQNQMLDAAHRLMRANRIRHLPVLDGGKLVGVVSERDLHLVETLKDVDPATVPVEDAMTPDPFTIGPDALLERVAQEMADHKYGSAVVVEKGKVIGIFTTTDALRAIIDLLKGRA